MTKQLSDGFKRSFYWDNDQTIPAEVINKGTNIYELLSVKILFVLAYVIAENAANDEAGIKSNREHFLPRVEIKKYNVLIDGRNFYDQPVDNWIKQYDEVQQDNVMITLQDVY